MTLTPEECRALQIEWLEEQVIIEMVRERLARQQLESLMNPAERGKFLLAQDGRHNPGGGGYLWDLRGRPPTRDYAEWIAITRWQWLDGTRGMLAFARLSLEDRSVRRGPLLLSPELCAIVEAFRGYPSDTRDMKNWTKREQRPRLRPLRRHTGIRVTRAQREALWPKQGRGRLDHRRQPDAKAGTPEEDGTVETH